ncbi:hypothetical protein QQ008_05475 [Fulvivirgaceae bacterium BMA10]|uniref:Carboxypeptidase regulatory-like domain-containing protein n=1 Tax=Splendidivirga corallicola TaxID=3051826 RepID=A0ABT8KJB7_9BACT|nr:hypothetical protein [Fulvivirgaceae bacterium BMA10]
MKKIYPKLKFTLLLFAILFTFQGCYYDDYCCGGADLEVHVYGLFSGRPREGIRVSLYRTEEDAENNIDPIRVWEYTDYDGNVIFYDLPTNRRYWIKARAQFASNIRKTRRLRSGHNFRSISIL